MKVFANTRNFSISILLPDISISHIRAHSKFELDEKYLNHPNVVRMINNGWIKEIPQKIIEKLPERKKLEIKPKKENKQPQDKVKEQPIKHEEKIEEESVKVDTIIIHPIREIDEEIILGIDEQDKIPDSFNSNENEVLIETSFPNCDENIVLEETFKEPEKKKSKRKKRKYKLNEDKT